MQQSTNSLFLVNTHDLTECQNASYYNFLINTLFIETNCLPNPILNLNKKTNNLNSDISTIYLLSNDIKIISSILPINQVIIEEKTLLIKIIIPYERKNLKEKYEISNNREYLYLGEIPLLTSNGTFVIRGIERVFVNQIIKNPGIKFLKNVSIQNFSYYINLINEKGLSIDIKFAKKENFKKNKKKSVVINTYNRIGLNSKIIKFSKEFLNRSYIKNLNIFDNIIETKQNILIQEILIENFNLNTTEEVFDFSFGQLGRYNLNKDLRLCLPKNIKQLTIQDLIKIIKKSIDALEGNIIYDDLDDFKNKQIFCIGDNLKMNLISYITLINNKYKNFENEDVFKDENEEFNIKKSPTFKKIFDDINDYTEFSELSQLLDNLNPLSDIIHKRRVLVENFFEAKEQNSSTLRDIHFTQHGHICPIDTIDGDSSGLVLSLALFSRITNIKECVVPYIIKNLNENLIPILINAIEIKDISVVFSDNLISQSNNKKNKYLLIKKDCEIKNIKITDAYLKPVLPSQFFSIAILLQPFVEHNDSTRAQMGANMQRQAVPLVYAQAPIVGTNAEVLFSMHSNFTLKSYSEGIVSYLSNTKIQVADFFGQKINYILTKFIKSNQKNYINQRLAVWLGEKIFSGQILADGSSFEKGELSLGRNVTVAYMPWYGYNFEDAVLISERLVTKNYFTSLNISEHKIKLNPGFHWLTKHFKKVYKKIPVEFNNYDEYGLLRIGSQINALTKLALSINLKKKKKRESNINHRSSYLILRKLTKKIFSEIQIGTPFYDLIKSSRNFDKFWKNYINIKKKLKKIHINKIIKKFKKKKKAFTLPFNVKGKIVSIKIIKEIIDLKKKKKKIIYYAFLNIAQLNKIRPGDKVAGRHGNKGVISRIIPKINMPFLSNGTEIDMILNPLGVPSRMNIGQIFECMLGLTGSKLNKRFKIINFDETYDHEASSSLIIQILKKAAYVLNDNSLFNLYTFGKSRIMDSTSGYFFDNSILIGKSYIIKLFHIISNKSHSRSDGSYSNILEQPSEGKKKEGGQRFGEMETWAIEAHGCSFSLKEILHTKSDNVFDRYLTNLQAKGDIVSNSLFLNNFSESFLIFIRELNALGISISFYKINAMSSTIDINFTNIFKSMEKVLRLSDFIDAKTKLLDKKKKIKNILQKIIN